MIVPFLIFGVLLLILDRLARLDILAGGDDEPAPGTVAVGGHVYEGEEGL